MTEETVLWRDSDLTPRICRKCHCAIRGPLRRVSENGHTQYECIHPCTDREWIESCTGEPEPQDHFAEYARTEIAAMRRSDE